MEETLTLHEIPQVYKATEVDDLVHTLKGKVEVLKVQAACTHHHNGVIQYSPFLHAWKCDMCDHVKQDDE